MIGKTAQVIGGFTAFLASVATIATVAEPYIFRRGSPEPAPVQQPGEAVKRETVIEPTVPEKSDGAPMPASGGQEAISQPTVVAMPLPPVIAPPNVPSEGKSVPVAGVKNLTVEEGGQISLCGVSGSFVKIWRAADGSLLDRYTIYIPKATPGVALAKHEELVANKGEPVAIGSACTVTVTETTTQRFPRVKLSEKRD